MNAKYISRSDLQKLVNKKIAEIGCTLEDYPLEPIEIAEKCGIEVEEVDYGTTQIGGQIYLGEKIKRITLNKRRSERGKRFDCMHEINHFWQHPKDICNFQLNQDKGIEWQANTGTALALMPKEIFIEKLFEYDFDIHKVADFFKLNVKPIEYRIRNLDIANNKVSDVHMIRYCPHCLNNTNMTDTSKYCNKCGAEMRSLILKLEDGTINTEVPF